jgi:hypothetical protein
LRYLFACGVVLRLLAIEIGPHWTVLSTPLPNVETAMQRCVPLAAMFELSAEAYAGEELFALLV